MASKSAAALLAAALTPALAAQTQQEPPPDVVVERSIDRELFADPVIDANVIDVDVSDGVATMSGEVSNMVAKDRAVRIAQQIAGVIVVEDRLTVEKTERSDASISVDLLMAFSSNAATDAWEIDTTVSDGAVTLTGTVQSAAEKSLATRVAKTVAGVRSVDNQIAIEVRSERADLEIEPEIEALIRWDARITGRVDADVDSGRVALSGAVGSAYDKELAIAHARAPSVTHVDASGLQVLPQRDDSWRRESDQDDNEIAAAVERALQNDPLVGTVELTAEVDDGSVTISGVVPSLQAKRAAGEIAQTVAGVRQVLNFVKVRPELEITDEETADAARAALARDPIVAASDVTVLVDHAVVKLYGVVDTRFERAHAANVVANVNGVVDVNNYLASYEALSENPAPPFEQ